MVGPDHDHHAGLWWTQPLTVAEVVLDGYMHYGSEGVAGLVAAIA